MSEDFDPKKPGDKRTGYEYEKDQRAVKEVTDKILKPHFKTEADDDLTKLVKWRNSIRDKVRAVMTPIIDASLMRSPNDPENPHTPTGRAKLLVMAHRLYLDECRKLSREDAIFMLAFVYADRTIEDFL